MRRSVMVLSAVAALVAGCTNSAASRAPEPVPPGSPSETTVTGTPTQRGPAHSFTVLATGDVLIHPALTEQAVKDGGGKRDYTKILAGVKPAVSAADLAICHLETPLAAPDGPFEGYPRFSAPPEIATALAKTGYDTCSTASNHTFDQGTQGVRDTLDALDAAGVKHTGSARTEREAHTPLIIDVHGVKVAQVSFTFGFNSGTGPAKPWMGNVLDVDSVLAAARAARKAGAEVVIASLHWGIEDQQKPTAEQRSIARKILADPAVDLIVGHHAHVVQPFEEINGKWVVYGLGNLVARHDEPRGTTEEGVMARFRFTKGSDGWQIDRAEYLPTLIDLGPPIRVRDLTTDTHVARPRRDEALHRTDGVVRSLGAAADGLTTPSG